MRWAPALALAFVLAGCGTPGQSALDACPGVLQGAGVLVHLVAPTDDVAVQRQAATRLAGSTIYATLDGLKRTSLSAKADAAGCAAVVPAAEGTLHLSASLTVQEGCAQFDSWRGKADVAYHGAPAAINLALAEHEHYHEDFFGPDGNLQLQASGPNYASAPAQIRVSMTGSWTGHCSGAAG